MSGSDKSFLKDPVHWAIAQNQSALEPLLKDLRNSFAGSGKTIYRARNEIKQSVWMNLPVAIKSFGSPNSLRRYVYGRFRSSKARRSYENALRLRDLGIQTPEPIGFIEYYRGQALGESFYVCRLWESKTTIREVLDGSGVTERLTILAELGRFAWLLHRLGVDFRDFSPGNILLAQKPGDFGAWDFCLVDINRIVWGPMDLARRMKSFAMLWVQDADLAVIVDAYCALSGDDPVRAKRLACGFSGAHKKRSARKERIKRLLGL